MPEESRGPLRRCWIARRGFQTVDIAILAAAILSGLTLSCWVEVLSVANNSWKFVSYAASSEGRAGGDPHGWRVSAAELSGFTLHLVMLSVPLLAMLSFAVIAIRLIPPRPRRRRLMRQPGMAAAFAVAVALVGIGLFHGITRLADIRDRPLFAWNSSWVVTCAPAFVGLSIVSAWSTLLGARQWRPEPTWIDRLGRIVAATWILAGLFPTCHYLVYVFLYSSANIIFQD
jgi:hypothetical protein